MNETKHYLPVEIIRTTPNNATFKVICPHCRKQHNHGVKSQSIQMLHDANKDYVSTKNADCGKGIYTVRIPHEDFWNIIIIERDYDEVMASYKQI